MAANKLMVMMVAEQEATMVKSKNVHMKMVNAVGDRKEELK